MLGGSIACMVAQLLKATDQKRGIKYIYNLQRKWSTTVTSTRTGHQHLYNDKDSKEANKEFLACLGYGVGFFSAKTPNSTNLPQTMWQNVSWSDQNNSKRYTNSIILKGMRIQNTIATLKHAGGSIKL